MDITAKNIGVKIAGNVIFDDISLELKGNEMIALTGKSGCGKTTLLNCLGLIQGLSSGEIFIDERSTKDWKDKDKTKFWHESAGFIYQDYGIIESENVFYNVTLNKNRHDHKKAEDFLEQVDLKGRGADYASVLSGGEKQRLGIARALYKNAKVVFADEPTASLDSKNREMVVNLLKGMRENGAMIIIATHDERLVSECDRSIDLNLAKKQSSD